ncbi:ribonuclease domain-containing protein [Nocardia sp. NBC_01009]|uniref:ribonuclease domain-containing protein n=1 Tax=Nocardia sp. NBC_01009 TaxID=2975996 RepID=UPI00386E0B8D|nr:ribonuclease [Nocardia sp. NBC_01009]
MIAGKRGTYTVLGVLAVLIAVVGLIALNRGGDGGSVLGSATSSARGAPTTQAKPPAAGSTTTPLLAGTTAPAASRAPGVPDRAYATLAEIDAGRWPDSANAAGTKGGDRWMNRAGTLAARDSTGKPITYQEWDVNPKQRNRSRDAERIVTGSDGSAWYTGDHYETFARMR